MNKRTWAIVTMTQTVAFALAIVLVSVRPGVAAPGAGPAEQVTPAPTFRSDITRQEARLLIEAAIEKAIELRGTIAAAVLDSGGNIISLDRMDGRGVTSDKFAVGKAVGALSTRQPTRNFADVYNQRPDRYFGVLGMLPGQVYMVNGGQPIAENGFIIGAMGVAGLGPGEDDMAIDAGIALWQRTRPSINR